MKESVLNYLECPVCHSAYALQANVREGNEVMEGKLTCQCGSYPIVRGVPRLMPEAPDQANWKTAQRFGEEWNQFSMLTPEYEKQFLSWIEPVQQNYFAGKTVLDVGCGKGRHMLQAKKFGAQEVIGIDLSHAVDAAFMNIGREPGVHIIQANIYALPLKKDFDYAYSIGVLHHTPNPEESFNRMVDKVKAGGGVSAWVYGREGNGWIIYILNPIRSITSKLPLPITKAFAFACAVVLQVALKLLYAPAAKHPTLKRLLPYSDYLCSISGYSFAENFSIVFDHLLPEIAFYIRQEDFRSWFTKRNLQHVVVTQRYGNSWRGFGETPRA